MLCGCVPLCDPHNQGLQLFLKGKAKNWSADPLFLGGYSYPGLVPRRFVLLCPSFRSNLSVQSPQNVSPPALQLFLHNVSLLHREEVRLPVADKLFWAGEYTSPNQVQTQASFFARHYTLHFDWAESMCPWSYGIWGPCCRSTVAQVSI
jgi:hypothetical protein